MLLDLKFASASTPERVTLNEVAEKAKPLPPETLGDFGVAFSIVTSTVKASDPVLDRVLCDSQMTLRQLRDQMGIHFQIK